MPFANMREQLQKEKKSSSIDSTDACAPESSFKLTQETKSITLLPSFHTTNQSGQYILRNPIFMNMFARNV